MLWGSRAIFLRLFWVAPRKISRWKNSFVFQRLMFLYQLVNLVLETCFIFSKILKLSKTFFCLEFLVSLDHLINERCDSPIPDYVLEQNVQESVNSWVFGVFYKVIYSVDLGFLTHLFSERCLNCWLVKEIITLNFGRHVKNVFYLKRLRDMASLWDVIRHFSGWGFYIAFATPKLVVM